MKSKLKRKIASCEEPIIRKRRNVMENQRSDLDQQSEADTHNTKKSDSCYSTGCSNSQSQRSESSKSIHSNSGSSNSSGYGGLPATAENFPQPHAAKSGSKIKDHKKKKCKTQEVMMTVDDSTSIDEIAAEDCCNEEIDSLHKKDVLALGSLNNNNADGVNNCTNSSPNCNIMTNNNGNSSNSVISNGNNINSYGALHLATLAHTLNCIKRMKSADADLDSNFEPLEVNNPSDVQESLIIKLKIDQIRTGSGEFCLIVSLHDGKVLYVTQTLTDVLGFPSDMWIGRSLIDFIHPKDRVAFENHITIRVAGPMSSNSPPMGKSWKMPSNTFFCCLRKYRGLKISGFGVKDKVVEYVPFQLSMSFKEVKGEVIESVLLITATAVKTAYKRPDETQEAPSFVTRHLANCILSHVDTEVISYLGYLPQDIIGRSVFDFYHPEDLPLLKEIYESVMAGNGSPFRSKPYRFRTQNGGYVLLETEWSSFINPWSRRLEFAIGLHKVLKGPPNPDVFAAPTEFQQIPDEVVPLFDEVLKENKAIQEEIKRLLNEPVFRCTESAKQQVSKKCKDLATFMESLMDEIMKPDNAKFDDLQADGDTFSEKDSVMLGEISPHHEYCDSKSSTETPPSYNQLNYNENLQRFFESKPKTSRMSDENSDLKIHSALDDEEKISPEMADNSKCRSPVNGSGTCSGSGSGLSSASNCINGTDSSGTNASKHQDSCEKLTVLTEAVLLRHNEDMEKVLMKKHRDLRIKDGKMHELRLRTSTEKFQDHCHGVKRSGSQSWEEDKISKHRHTEAYVRSMRNCNVGSTNNKTEISSKADAIESGIPHIYQQGPTSINLWPPFSVAAFNHSVASHATYTTSNGGMPVAGMIPVYYIPTGATPAMSANNPAYPQNTIHVDGGTIAPNEHPGPPSPLLVGGNTFMPQVQFMNAFPVYSAVGFGTPLMYSPLMMAPQAPLRTQSNKLPDTIEEGASKFQRPASQATSVKAEPGSVMGSMVLSECSKKEEKSMDSPEADSPNQSQDEGKTKEIIMGITREAGTGTGDESSYSSFSSFLKTDDSMRSSEETEPGFGQSSNSNWEKIKDQSNTLSKPVRKGPPWLEQIKLTPELAFRYQINERELNNVLESDMEALKVIEQPKLVDEQLEQLYVDLELEGLSTKLKLDEGITTSSCSSSSDDLHSSTLLKHKRKKKRQHDCTQLIMIYEENMSLPSPTISAVVTN